jgi:hypothetical protein
MLYLDMRMARLYLDNYLDKRQDHWTVLLVESSIIGNESIYSFGDLWSGIQARFGDLWTVCTDTLYTPVVPVGKVNS